MNYLLATYDVDALRAIIFSLKSGDNIQNAFINATGSDLAGFEREWRHYIKSAHRWLWIYEINEYLWGFILALAVLAFIFRLRRNKNIEKEWQEDDQLPPEEEIDES